MAVYSPRILYRRDRRRDPSKWRIDWNKEWIDPYPWIAGTLPEKMVFAELAKRHVPFIFQADWWQDVTSKFEMPELRDIQLNQMRVVPDIFLPELKVIVEVQGSYWHSPYDAIEHDFDKKAFYAAYGYQCVELWDFDIVKNVVAQVDRIPGVARAKPGPPTLGSHVGLGASSVAAMNRSRARPRPQGLKRRVLRGRRRVTPH